jgi:hypothetical protein
MIGILLINPGNKVIKLNSTLFMMQNRIEINPTLQQKNSRTQRNSNVEMDKNEASNNQNHLGSADQRRDSPNLSIGVDTNRPTM